MSPPDFFRAWLDGMIDLKHPLAVLGRCMPWTEIEKSLGPLFARRARMGRLREDAEMFGPTAVVLAGGVSAAGRPRLPIRLMVALLYLKHAFNESDELVVERWAQDVYFQYFSGQEYFEARLPCDPSQIGRFRRVLGEAGVEQLLKSTIETAVRLQAIKKAELQKAITHPTDSRLLDVARDPLAELVKKLGLSAKQTFEREAATLLQDLDVQPTTAVVDLGYRGVDAEIAPVALIHRGKSKRLSTKLCRWLKRRQAIEPVIGHVKQDHGMQRCWLKGSEGDALHAVLCAAGFNLRWLLRAIARKALKGFFAPILAPGCHDLVLHDQPTNFRTKLPDLLIWLLTTQPDLLFPPNQLKNEFCKTDYLRLKGTSAIRVTPSVCV